MSLSARIALRPSPRLALLETVMAVTGTVIVAATTSARWPQASPTIVAVALAATVTIVALAIRRWRGSATHTIVVSERDGVGLVGSEDTWRLVEPSLLRPGFAVVALARDGEAGRLLLRAVCDVDLAAADRWALHRYLRWLPRGARSANGGSLDPRPA